MTQPSSLTPVRALHRVLNSSTGTVVASHNSNRLMGSVKNMRPLRPLRGTLLSPCRHAERNRDAYPLIICLTEAIARGRCGLSPDGPRSPQCPGHRCPTPIATLRRNRVRPSVESGVLAGETRLGRTASISEWHLQCESGVDVPPWLHTLFNRNLSGVPSSRPREAFGASVPSTEIQKMAADALRLRRQSERPFRHRPALRECVVSLAKCTPLTAACRCHRALFRLLPGTHQIRQDNQRTQLELHRLG